ncbi:unnamed protein product [Closterium sp. Naga37s-1]|nr:unnamed protein product [Closterium sp. Naga37s-1]
MCHTGAPQLLWPEAVRYAAHQLNLWPSLSHVTPQSRPVPVVSGGERGAVAEGEGTGASGAGGVGSGGAGSVGVEVTPVEDTATSSRRPCPASPPGFPSVPQFPRRSQRPVAAKPGGVPAGGTRGTGGAGGGGAGSGGAGAGGTGTVAPTPCTVHFLTSEQRLLRLEREERERFERALQQQEKSQSQQQERAEEGSQQQQQPPESSPTVFHDPLSDYLLACHPVVSRVLSALVTHPSAPPLSVSALVTTVASFASSRRLDYTAHLVSGPARSPSSGGAPVFPLEVLEDRQFELGFLAAAVPHLCAMLLAPEGDPDALDIRIPHTRAEAVSGPWVSYWIAAEEAEIASYRSTGTYVDAVLRPGTNVVSGMLLYKVKRPPGSPPVFKACYVARGFSQRKGVDVFQTFAPTPKMTTLRVLLHIAAQRDYEFHSLDFSSVSSGEPARADLAASRAWLHWRFPSCDPVTAAWTGLRPAPSSP